jgi:hypothetical protein
MGMTGMMSPKGGYLSQSGSAAFRLIAEISDPHLEVDRPHIRLIFSVWRISRPLFSVRPYGQRRNRGGPLAVRAALNFAHKCAYGGLIDEREPIRRLTTSQFAKGSQLATDSLDRRI